MAVVLGQVVFSLVLPPPEPGADAHLHRRDALRTMLDIRRCRDLDARLGFQFGGDVYGARLTGDGLSVAQGDPPGPRVASPEGQRPWAPAVYGQTPLARLEANGVLKISGDRRLAERFVTLFPRPERFDR
jgi:hypothetical protein